MFLVKIVKHVFFKLEIFYSLEQKIVFKNSFQIAFLGHGLVVRASVGMRGRGNMVSGSILAIRNPWIIQCWLW